MNINEHKTYENYAKQAKCGLLSKAGIIKSLIYYSIPKTKVVLTQLLFEMWILV